MHKSSILQLVLQVFNIGTPALGLQEEKKNLKTFWQHKPLQPRLPLALGDKLICLKQMDKTLSLASGHCQTQAGEQGFPPLKLVQVLISSLAEQQIQNQRQIHG